MSRATAPPIVIGTTKVTSGTTGGVLYQAAGGVVGQTAAPVAGQVLGVSGGVPAFVPGCSPVPPQALQIGFA